MMYTCKYCGASTTNTIEICNTCKEKLTLIRKIREILFAIKHAETEDKT